MKTTRLEMGLMRIQAETPAESQAIIGILDIMSHLGMPDAVVNDHGMKRVGQNYFNYCITPDGRLTGKCRKQHPAGHGCDCLRPGIESDIKRWRKLPWNYNFKNART